MKRILIIILVILLVALGFTIIFNGFKIGSFEVLGFKNLGKLDRQLENALNEATTLTSVTFPEKLSSLTSASKQLVTTKEKYQDKVAYSSEEDVRRANEIETYQVDFLFTRLGNHARKYGLEIDLDAKQTSATGVYNLNFTVHGKYALIADFVRAVENDQELTFTIENFILEPDVNAEGTANIETLRATFIVSELRLDVDESISNSSEAVPMSNANNTSNTTSNSNTTNTNSTANTANTENTVNADNTANTTNNVQN